MRVVLFSRAPGWYSFKGDRFVTRLAREHHEVVGIVVERRKLLAFLRDWVGKLGPQVVVGKLMEKVLRRGGASNGAVASPSDGSPAAAPVPLPPVYRVDSHNSPASADILRALEPDVLILRGCGIIRKPILDIPKRGVINGHYAFLPAYRGVDVTEWAVLHGDPPAVSVHFVNEGVDTGATLAARELPVAPGDTLGRLREKSAGLSLDLMVEVLNDLEAGREVPPPARKPGGRQYYKMHPRLRQLASERLRSVL
ncbi:MAG TPA: formyl transferase [Chthonomonadaceae bacterium]|nr:formyl transferase [Chthonomonadaceae bacterium]